MLTHIPGLSNEAITVIWTMVERNDHESAFRPFWDSLPSELHTGMAPGSTRPGPSRQVA